MLTLLSLLRILPLRVQAAELADDVDLLFLAITAITVFFTAAIFLIIIFLSVRYRRGAKVDRSHAPAHNTLIEIIWSVGPLGIALGIFLWSSLLYIQMRNVPADAMEIHVVGKQWMWKMQHPTGKWENNELHLPVGRPIKFTMTSEDVIHCFYVPEFRYKQDVVPGQFTQMVIKPTKTGVFRLYCAEFCGMWHSGMVGTVTVMEQAEYDAWLSRGSVPESVAADGKRLFTMHGCNGCHGAGSSVRAPQLEGIFGRVGPVQIPKPGTPLEEIVATTVLKDSRYVHDAIMLPEKEVAAGYKPIMPTFKNKMSEEDVLRITAYLRSMGSTNDRPERQIDNSSSLSEADYKARTGFTPENLKSITSDANTRSPGSQSTSPQSPVPSPGAGAGH